MRKKISVTASDMMQLREQGLSNHDIARSLEVSEQTVRRYIGKQPGRMESLEAFRDKPLVRTKDESKVVSITKYEPKPVYEKYMVGDIAVELDTEDGFMVITREGDSICVPNENVPDLVQFLAWAMRERLEADADERAE